MLRPRSITLSVFVVSMLAAGVLVGCGGPAEEGTLNRYFRAVRTGDFTTLDNIATATLESGIVQDFTITSVGEEQRRTLRVKDLFQALEQADAAEDEFGAEMKVYQDENIEAIDRVLQAERDEEAEVAAQDEEVQQEWARLREEMSGHAKKVSNAGQELSAERALADTSVFNATNPIDITQYDGELISKQVTIDASVDEDGSMSQKTLVVTMHRTELTGGDGRDISGRWVITGISES